MDLTFLKSNRFWALIGIGIVTTLKMSGILVAEIADPLLVILGGFITVRTIDRASEKIGLAP